MAKHEPGKVWRATGPGGEVVTVSQLGAGVMVVRTVMKRNATAFYVSRSCARNLARRILQCLEETK